MHIASEVSSTTCHQPASTNGSGMTNNHSNNNIHSKNSKKESSNNNTNNNNSSTNNNSGLLTAETLAERTLDGLLADHPGELVRTGSPHIVSIYTAFFYYLSNEL